MPCVKGKSADFIAKSEVRWYRDDDRPLFFKRRAFLFEEALEMYLRFDRIVPYIPFILQGIPIIIAMSLGTAIVGCIIGFG